jgi:phosphonate transport system substrate-binding protein
MANPQGNDKGSANNPINMAFVPSQDASKIISSGENIANQLKAATGLTFRVSVPTSYAAVVEAIGAGQVDVAWLSTFAYVLAKDKGSAEIALATLRSGSKTYRSQIITHVDSGITNVEGLRGKKFAFVDAVSASGFLYPNALLKARGFDYQSFFSETQFAGGHPQVVIAVYNKQVDGGATFGDSREGGPPTDARTNVVSTLPDVMSKVRVIGTTDPIPNDTVSVRTALPADLKKLITDGLLYVAGTTEGAAQLRALYNIDGLGTATDADYNSVRAAATALGLNLEEQIAPPKPKV